MISRILKVYQNLSMIKKVITLFLIIGAIPLLFTTFIISLISEQALTSSVYENNRLSAVGIAREVNAVIEAKSHIIMTVASSDEIISGDPARQITALKNIVKQNPGIISLAITDSQGMQTVNTTPGPLANLGEREYFKKVKNGEALAFSDVIRPKGIDQSSVLAAVPIKDTHNTFLGMVVGVIDLHILSEQVNNNKIGNTGYVFIVDRLGKILAHPDKSLIEKELPAIPPVKAAWAGQTGAVAYEYQGQEKLAGFSSIALTGWAVVVQQTLDEAVAGAFQVKLIGAGFTLGALVLSVLIGFFATNALIRPIRDLVIATGQLAEGNLQAKANVTTCDEIGQLGVSFNSMASSLRELIRGIVGASEQVAAAAEQLSSASSETERAADQIVGIMTGFAQGAYQQTQEVNKSLDIVQKATQVSQQMEERANLAVGLCAEMTDAAESGRTAACKAVEKINEIREGTAAASKVVAALGEKSSYIGQTLDVISQIAGQTNLLALNAAIEAARAGEQGRGFAVVAEEVRKLAEQSQTAARQIALIVQDIQAQTTEAVYTMRSSNAKVNEGVVVVSTAGQALEEILAKIEQNVTMIADIHVSTDRQMQNIGTMRDSTTQIAAIVRQTSAGAETTAAASQEVSASIKEIASASQALAGQASELQAMVAKFRM